MHSSGQKQEEKACLCQKEGVSICPCQKEGVSICPCQKEGVSIFFLLVFLPWFGILACVSNCIMSKQGSRIIKAVFCVLLIGAGVYWWKFSPVEAQSQPVSRVSLQQTVFGTGTLEAKTRVAISPYATGQVQVLHADQGDVVKRGELLVEMNAEDISQQLAVAEADLSIAKALLQRNAAEISAAGATLEYARITFERMENLRQSNSVSQTDVDKSRQGYQVALADLEQAEKRQLEIEAEIARHEAQINYFRSKLAETQLKAPFDALVIRRNREQGSIVNPGVSIMDVVDTGQIWASVWVDETAMALIHPGMPVDVVFRALPDKKFSGKVTRTSRETDRETREYRVDIMLDALPDNWVLGQRLEVYIHVAEIDNCLAVPNNLICRDKQRTFVLVEEDGRIAERDVKIGIQTRQHTRILSGLDEADRLILHPLRHREHINRRIAR